MAALVGRGTEQAELNGTWQAARGGEARVIGLAGSAGIGKTALVSKFVRDAAPRRQVWLSGAPEERTLSWGVLGQAVPALGPAPVWAAPDPEADPLYVGQSFLDDIRAAGETILVLDDAQWADRQSQAALRFTARHMTGLPVLVIVIHNDEDPESPLEESWRRLFGSAHGSLVTLSGLTPEDLVLLAVARGHFGLSPAAAARLPGARTHNAGMRFFGGAAREHSSRPLADPRYVQAVLGQLTAVFDQALDLPRRRSQSVDTLTFGDVVDYFTGERPDDPRIKAGALLLSAGQPPGRVVFQVFLDEADQVCGDASGTPYGRRIVARRLDAELTDYLGGGDLLIFQ